MTDRIETFCVDCKKRGKCAEPCKAWYDCLERQLKAED